MKSHQANSKQEPLCLQFDWGISAHDPNRIYMHEEYAGADDGKEGLTAHANSAHFARFAKFVEEKDPFNKPQVVQFYKNLEL